MSYFLLGCFLRALHGQYRFRLICFTGPTWCTRTKLEFLFRLRNQVGPTLSLYYQNEKLKITKPEFDEEGDL